MTICRDDPADIAGELRRGDRLRILRRLADVRAARERDRSYHNFIPHPFPRRHDHANAIDRADAQP